MAASDAKTYAYLAGVAVLGSATVMTGITWLVPIAQTALAYPVLLRDLRSGELGQAIRHMLFWAFILSVTMIQFTIHQHDVASETILRGEMYREEIFSWIRTGVGREGTPSQFIPEHILHYGTTLVLSILTIGAGGLFLGAILLGYMNYYVGSLILLGSNPELASTIGWPIWSMVRVAGFVCGAIAMAYFGLTVLLRRGTFERARFRQIMTWSFGLWLADIVLKATLAPFWRGWLETIL